ncbi:MAG: hypothetical protein K6T72_15790, partial [Anoxybacillus sp.]|nr:hypothetical protein [Anoxybacillus sp.]
ELSRPLPGEETERRNVGTRMPRDMGGFVLISYAEIQGASHTHPHCSKKYPAVTAKRTHRLLDINKNEKVCDEFCRKIFFWHP